MVALVGTGAAYAWTARQPRIYQADCLIEYDLNPPKPLGHAVEEVSAPIGPCESREYATTQNKIIASRSVAERVVRKLSLHEDPDFNGVPEEQRGSWKPVTITQAAQKLQRQVTVLQERETRLVHVLAKDQKPERAMLIANTVATAYIEKTMQDKLGATTSALEWLGKQLDGLKLQLEQSELALHEFSEQHTNLAVSLEDQQNIISANIAQLSSDLLKARARRIEHEARVQEMQAANREDPFEVYAGAALQKGLLISDLKATYQSLLRQQYTMSPQYGDAHPKMVAIQNQLESIKRALRAEIDGMIQIAQSDLKEAQHVELGLRDELARANKQGLELNLQEITQRRLTRERDNQSKLYGTLLERTAQTDLTRALQVSYVRVVDQALVPGVPVSPKVTMNLVLGALVGLLLGVGLALMLEQLDRTIRTVEDAEAVGVTILGIMPKIDETMSSTASTYGYGYGYSRKRRGNHAPEQITNRDMVVHTHPKSSAAECCRTIRTNLTFMSADKPRRTVVVTSGSPREGKTTVALSLAISLAQSGKRVLVVDTDLRKPRLHRALGLSLARGVTTVLVGEATHKEAVQETEVPGLTFLASGPIPPNPSELLHTAQFRQLLQDLAKTYDHVILDSSPLAAVTDAAIIAPQVDCTILVIHSQHTTRDAARVALRQLRDVGCQPTGGVLNQVDLSQHKYGYGSYYYYNSEGYYEADSSDSDVDKPSRPIAQA